FQVTLPLPRRNATEGVGGLLVRARAVDAAGRTGLARSVTVDGTPVPAVVPAVLRTVPRGPWFDILLEEGAGWNHLEGGPDAFVSPWDWGARIAVAQPEWDTEPAVSAFDPRGDPVAMNVEPPPLARPGEEIRPDGAAVFRFAAETLTETAYASVRTEPARPTGELRAVSPLYFLDLGHVPYADEFAVTLQPEPGVEFDPARLGIFVQGSKGLRYIGTTRDEGWTAKTRTRFGIGLFEDKSPPRIGQLSLETRHGRTTLTFRAGDSESGLNCDDLEVFFDGRPILYELDDETGDVLAYPPLSATAGAGGHFEVRVTDRCGNTSTRSETVAFP
ncbi:MAG: hypothetical protein HKN12_00155, partial [Gemmatimonadetes bacterium]|nr:hypothetical protein [Gemmatimonadota bacterium]